MKLKLSELKPNTINDEIYSVTDLSDLVNSIKQNGQLEPISINKNKTIISGHRRYYSMKQLGFTECDVVIKKYENEIIGLVEHNRTRVKSVQDILNESRILEKEYKKIIGRGKRNDLVNVSRTKSIIEVSKKIGIGTSKVKQLKTISNYEPGLLSKIDSSELSVNGAYQLVKDKHMVSKQKTQNSEETFKNKFSQLLKKYNPEIETIKNVVSKTYPYSINHRVEINHKLKPDLERKRIELIEHLDFLKSLSAQQEVLYKKQKEIEKCNFDELKVEVLRDFLWMPSDLDNKEQTIKEIEHLEPSVEIVDKDSLSTFNILRVMIHSLEWQPNPGRR